MSFRIPVFAFVLIGCLSGGSSARAANVLLLGDTEADLEVGVALENAGHAVTVAGPYFAWDGIQPDVFDHQVVVLLSGEAYELDLQPAALFALENFLASGCGLVTTEWSAYAVSNGKRSEAFGDLLPVESPFGDFGEGAVWSVLTPGHPLVAGVPASFADDGGWSELDAPTGTTVVIADPDHGANPLLSYARLPDGGTSVHVNHDLTYELESVPANILRLITNAARFAACLPFADGFESGTTEAWSVTP